MKPAMSVVSLLLLLATTTQGIRLDEQSLAAYHYDVNEKGSSMAGETKVGVGPGINGHASGRSRKLMSKTVVKTLKKERSKETLSDAPQSHHHSKEEVGRRGEDLHGEPSVSKQLKTYSDVLDIAGMDYSPAKKMPPIHN